MLAIVVVGVNSPAQLSSNMLSANSPFVSAAKLR